MSIKSFFSPQYLFSFNPAFISPAEKLFLAAGAVLVLLSIVLKIASVLAPNPIDKSLREKFYHLFLTIGISELLWYLCRYENAKFFGTPFVAWLIALIGVIWLVMILIKMFKTYSQSKVAWEKEQMKAKYLPK